jgi:outer membrane protein assembly factor BamB
MNTPIKPARFTLLIALLLAAPAVRAENWPGWRGPRGDGSSDEKQVPVRWSATDNVAWRVDVPGLGHSSPITWEDRLFLTTCVTDTGDRLLICLDRKTGKTLWSQTVITAPLEGKHNLNSYSSSTPATDGRLVYVSFLDKKEMAIAAYDFEGNRRWAVKPGVFSSVHGYCASPVLYKDKVIINGDHDGPSYLVALDQQTGKTLWKTPRENRTRSYCTPIIREIDGRTQMILSGDKCVASFDPNDGSRHWIIDGPTEQYVASLVYNGDLLFLTCGFPTEHVMGIKPDGKGNVTKTHVAWHHQSKDASYVPSPVAIGPYFVLADDFGVVTCFEAKTGNTMWREKLGRHFSASIVSANGLAYCLADEGLERKEAGVMTVIEPGPALKVVAKNTLGEPAYASPAISQGQLFIRTEKGLFCIGK